MEEGTPLKFGEPKNSTADGSNQGRNTIEGNSRADTAIAGSPPKGAKPILHAEVTKDAGRRPESITLFQQPNNTKPVAVSHAGPPKLHLNKRSA